MHTLDLHGVSIPLAIIKAENFLIEASFDKQMNAEIVTGKSGNMQERIIEDVIKMYDFDYYIPSYNTGTIIITQNEL
tara:strand:- start:4182 stop:4412 length:231 start_codon:yes stop_codon:yes gene_type:complete